jgi:hypothetical protein
VFSEVPKRSVYMLGHFLSEAQDERPIAPLQYPAHSVGRGSIVNARRVGTAVLCALRLRRHAGVPAQGGPGDRHCAGAEPPAPALTETSIRAYSGYSPNVSEEAFSEVNSILCGDEKATPKRWSTRMISHPRNPPIAQMSTVSRLMGITSASTRFVKKRRTTPTIALTTAVCFYGVSLNTKFRCVALVPIHLTV